MPRHLVAVHIRHHHVQDQQIINSELGVIRAGLSIVHGLHLKTAAFQHGLDGIGQQLLVFDDQNFHLHFLLF